MSSAGGSLPFIAPNKWIATGHCIQLPIDEYTLRFVIVFGQIVIVCGALWILNCVLNCYNVNIWIGIRLGFNMKILLVTTRIKYHDNHWRNYHLTTPQSIFNTCHGTAGIIWIPIRRIIALTLKQTPVKTTQPHLVLHLSDPVALETVQVSVREKVRQQLQALQSILLNAESFDKVACWMINYFEYGFNGLEGCGIEFILCLLVRSQHYYYDRTLRPHGPLR